MIVDITFTAFSAGEAQHEDHYARFQVLCCEGCHITIAEGGFFMMLEPTLRISDNWWGGENV